MASSPGERLAQQLCKEADRIQELGYFMPAHELRAAASHVSAAQRSLEYSKQWRRGERKPSTMQIGRVP